MHDIEIVETMHGNGKTRRKVRYDKVLYPIPTVRRGRDGRSYFFLKRKKIFIEDDISERELIKFIISQLAPKKRRKIKKKRLPVFPKGEIPPIKITSQSYSLPNGATDTKISQLKEEIQNLKLLTTDRERLKEALPEKKKEESPPTLTSEDEYLALKAKLEKLLKPKLVEMCVEKFGNTKSLYTAMPKAKLVVELARAFVYPELESSLDIKDVSSSSIPANAIKLDNMITEADTFYLNSPSASSSSATFTPQRRYVPIVFEEEEEDNPSSMSGEGSRKSSKKNEIDEKGLSTVQINEIMKPYRPTYLGCIGSDQISSLIPHVKPNSRVCFVMNTDPSTESGDHWCSILLDNREGGDGSIEYYSSLGVKDRRRITSRFLIDIVPLLQKINPRELPLKLKENLIPDQNATSSNCGFFATHFLIDRLSRGKSFAQATGYDKLGETMIEMYKEHFYPFKYIVQNGKGLKEKIKEGYEYVKGKIKKVVETVGDRVSDVVANGLRKDFPPSGRKVLEKHGDKKITEIVVARKPIQSWLVKVLDWVSRGRFSENIKDLKYDTAFHLMMKIRLSDGTSILTEKNEIIKLKEEGWNSGDSAKPEVEKIKIAVPPGISLNEFFNKAIKQYGKDRIFIYDSRTNSCQTYIHDLLKANGILTSEADKFIRQDVESIYRGMGVIGSINKAITDVAAAGNIVLEGRGVQSDSRRQGLY